MTPRHIRVRDLLIGWGILTLIWFGSLIVGLILGGILKGGSLPSSL
jgi:hypothetical protein